MLLVQPVLALLPLLPVAFPLAWIASNRYANARLLASVAGQARAVAAPPADATPSDSSSEDSFDSTETWEKGGVDTGSC